MKRLHVNRTDPINRVKQRLIHWGHHFTMFDSSHWGEERSNFPSQVAGKNRSQLFGNPLYKFVLRGGCLMSCH